MGMIDAIHHEQVLQGIDRAIPDLVRERVKQLEKWGVQEHEPSMWFAILGEELGEVGKEIAEGRIAPFDAAKYRKECLHTAAVAMAMVQCIDDGIA